MTAARNAALALEGLAMEGGVASVSRCLSQVFEEEVAAGRLARVDRILLHDDPAAAPAPPASGWQFCEGGSKLRFVRDLLRVGWAHRPEWVLFDHIGVARTAPWPIPGLPRRYAVFFHGGELPAVQRGNRFERALLGAETILTNSRFSGAKLAARVPALAERIRPVHLCIEPARLREWQDLAQQDAAGVRESAVLVVGRMWSVEPGKGHEALIDAWPAVLRRRPEARLWIAGDGDDRPRLEARAREQGVGAAVEFLGRISDAELSRRYRCARAYAMPSRQEGFGLVYAEAMWHGCPCVASSADAGAEVVADGETGRVVPYGDPVALATALLSLLEHPAEAERMGRAGRARVEKLFTYPRFRDDVRSALGWE